MKKYFAVLLLLALVLFAAAAAAEAQVKISMDLVPNRVSAGDEIRVTIGIKNVVGYEIPLQLYDPSDRQIEAFGSPAFLADGETQSWSGTWTVTEDQVEKGKISYIVRYKFKDESGEWVQKAVHFSKRIAAAVKEPEATPEPSPEPTPEPTPDPSALADVMLYSVLRPNPGDGTVSVACIDADGIFWSAETADIGYPFTTADILEMLRTRRGMTEEEHLAGTTYSGTELDKEFFRSLHVMASVVPLQEGSPRKTGIDVLELSVYALRNDPDGNPEPVLLGMSGSAVFENTDPNARALYLFMWCQLTARESYDNLLPYGFGAEGVAPKGFEPVTVREFFHLEGVDPETAEITAGLNDCESGFIPFDLTEEQKAWARKLLQRGIITGMDNPWVDSGGFNSYLFGDRDGNVLGSIEIEDGLAVGRDGMYRISILPKPVDTLPPEEIRLLTLKLEGVDYVIGQSTPRDLIRSGWRCSIQSDGSFLFQDAERYSCIVAKTAGGSPDEPIRYIDCQFEPWVSHEYSGFIGAGADSLQNGVDEKFLVEMGAKEEEGTDGISLTKTLSDGRTLYVYSADSPVILELRDAE